VASLLRAQQAVRDNNAEKRVSELNHVLAVIGQLQGTLDFERGGQVAAHLDQFYNVMRARVLQASIQSSNPILEELARHFSSLKEAWQDVERSTTNLPGAALTEGGGVEATLSL
jgi:flagellar protein FliS